MSRYGGTRNSKINMIYCNKAGLHVYILITFENTKSQLYDHPLRCKSIVTNLKTEEREGNAEASLVVKHPFPSQNTSIARKQTAKTRILNDSE
jgi:hypothetical protein